MVKKHQKRPYLKISVLKNGRYILQNNSKAFRACARFFYTSFMTVSKIFKERTNQEMDKIGPFFDFLLHFSVFLFEILNLAVFKVLSIVFSHISALFVQSV